MKNNIIQRTLQKMERSQKKKKEISEYINKYKPHLLKYIWRTDRINECVNIIRFREYVDWEVKLHKANFCKYDKFCLACATRRSIKMIQKFEKWIIKYDLTNKNWYHITLTIKHNAHQTLWELMAKLSDARDKLAQNYKNWKRPNQKKKSFFSQFEWIVASLEISYWKNWYHPHLHILACTDKEIKTEYSKFLWWYSNRDLQKEWYNITKDSYSVGIRKITVWENNFDRKSIWEVFKYAVKFSNLKVSQIAEVIELQHNRQYRFFSTYWIFRSWKFEESKESNMDNSYSDILLLLDNNMKYDLIKS